MELSKELEKIQLPDAHAPAEHHQLATFAMRAVLDANMDVLFPDNVWCKCVNHI